MDRFADQVVIVTGAGSGIGAATAKRFAAEGAKVVLAGRRREKLEETAAGLPPGSMLIHPADIGDQAAAEALVAAAVAKFGGLNVLVNNAGTAVFTPFTEGSVEDWHRVLRTNVDGVFFCSRAAMPHLLKTKGNIVNVSSVSGLGGDWGGSFYNASKGAVSNLTRALALEYGGRGVRINAVNPSFTHSEMTAQLNNETVLNAMYNRIPLGRGAEPSEVAAVIAFLASADASFVNGVNLPVDGGLMASNGQPNMG
jgi:meso-butanediol dehydrogenase/(S,S)-butanediol dehydrogenase/diacetyl reductase